MSSVANRILRLKDVQARTGLSRSTIYDHIKAKNFPQQVKLGPHSVGWVEHEINEWVAHVIEARNANTKPF